MGRCIDKYDIAAEKEGKAISKHCKMKPKIIGRPSKASRKIVNGHVNYRTAVDFRELLRKMRKIT